MPLMKPVSRSQQRLNVLLVFALKANAYWPLWENAKGLAYSIIEQASVVHSSPCNLQFVPSLGPQ